MNTNWDAFDCETFSPCQYIRKCMKNSVENMHIDVRVEGLIMAYERTKEPHESWNHLNTPKLKNIPGQNYQELSKLKILGLNALTINCTQSAIPCIAFCWQFLFAFSLQLTFGLPAVPLLWFKLQSVVSEVYSWLLQFASFSPRNGKLHCQCCVAISL